MKSLEEKLIILADAAKDDASSGTSRSNTGGRGFELREIEAPSYRTRPRKLFVPAGPGAWIMTG